jgi:hypothetical protein
MLEATFHEAYGLLSYSEDESNRICVPSKCSNGFKEARNRHVRY